MIFRLGTRVDIGSGAFFAFGPTSDIMIVCFTHMDLGRIVAIQPMIVFDRAPPPNTERCSQLGRMGMLYGWFSLLSNTEAIPGAICGGQKRCSQQEKRKCRDDPAAVAGLGECRNGCGGSLGL